MAPDREELLREIIATWDAGRQGDTVDGGDVTILASDIWFQFRDYPESVYRHLIWAWLESGDQEVDRLLRSFAVYVT